MTVSLIGGSIVGRVKFSTWILFSVFWSILVYPIIVHWVWCEHGFLYLMHHIDFAGGCVVHVNAGVSALVICYMVGQRKNFNQKPKPSSIKLVMLGTGILWFGWLGFNAGNGRYHEGEDGTHIKGDYGINFEATNALLVTNINASIGGVTWMLIEWFATKERFPTL